MTPGKVFVTVLVVLLLGALGGAVSRINSLNRVLDSCAPKALYTYTVTL